MLDPEWTRILPLKPFSGSRSYPKTGQRTKDSMMFKALFFLEKCKWNKD